MFGKLHFSASRPSLTIPNHLARRKMHIHFEHTRIKCEIITTDLLTFYLNKYLHFWKIPPRPSLSMQQVTYCTIDNMSRNEAYVYFGFARKDQGTL